MAEDILKRLEREVLIGYAPMQTMLVHEYGKPMEQHLSEWVVDNPKDYQDALKRSYEAGCDMGHTATQASSPFRSKVFGQAMVDRVYELNLESAKLAREVTPEDCYVVGNISHSNPDFLEPVGDMTPEEVYEGYRMQISGLAEGGVDAFHISGNHIDEGVIAIGVAKDLTDIPVIGQDVFYPTVRGFRSMIGLDPATSAARLDEAGADIIGTNCGSMTESLDPSAWYPAATPLFEEMRQGSPKCMCIQPDAGLARLEEEESVYPAPADEMAREVSNWVKAGARILGGCCGTTLEHFRQISAVIGGGKANS